MPWKRGKIKFDDGSVYPAELLVKEDGEVWNVKVLKDNKVIEEIDAQHFANKLKKDVSSVYPFTYEITE
ncbi:hypothetical protein [Geosporobacter ferrireducens]|uniref:Uncharacterized protein n=1 Tax=Geosporobacter ferrireducens TaxID=1424294 RepID=A0A1D8GE01_9FIRM|nr:hypothetical protein [Geosporobacter ferrireducens]AOT69122.1 hypothetical protein Gferi_05845 [Geosporobacter ferrireducens]MTI56798.1 hypothetical protein [Geosporobacter ferrireducens]